MPEMTPEEKIERLIKNRVSWLAECGPEEDIAISSRIRLARNLRGVPFPVSATPHQLSSAMSAVQMAVRHSCMNEPLDFELAKVRDLDRKLLFERRLISREFLADRPGAGLAVSADEMFGIMVNEEDHLRVQAMKPGFQLREAWCSLTRLDDSLAGELPYAFDNNLGFLTSCPTNVGTGMRASVMLHLPGLTLSGQINSVIQGVSKLGLAVRGIFGEGTENTGNLYQVSNQSTLGETEEQIIDRLSAVIKQIISHEKNARNELLEKRQVFLLDHVGRAYGILRHAYTISSKEAMDSLSALRIGVDLGMFSCVDLHTVNELFILIQPAHLQKHAGRELDSEERDAFRATMTRERLKNIDKKQP